MKFDNVAVPVSNVFWTTSNVSCLLNSSCNRSMLILEVCNTGDVCHCATYGPGPKLSVLGSDVKASK